MKLGDVLRTMRHGEGGQGAEETRDLTEVRSPVGGGSPRQGAGDYVVEEEVQWIPIHIVDPSPLQARRHFDEEAVEELAASIKVHGILQPMIVRPKGRRVELVVGERRLRATVLELRSDRAHLTEIVAGLVDDTAPAHHPGQVPTSGS